MTRRKLLSFLGMTGLAGMSAGAFFTTAHAENPYYSGPKSDHFDGKVFFNPGGEPPKGFTDLLRWRFGEDGATWPDEWPSPYANAWPGEAPANAGYDVILIGHATFLIRFPGHTILTDPVYSERASPVGFAGPKRINAPGIAFEDLPKVDTILVTHNHYDHLDLDTLKRIVRRDDPMIVTPLGNDRIILDEIPESRVAVGDWDDRIEVGKNVIVEFEPAHHWSARSLRDRRMALWCAFTIHAAGSKLHFVGDTGFHGGINFRRAADKHGEFELAILPIGAYAPRWFMKHQHMDPEEAVEAFRLLNAQTALGHHWGTFPLTNEPHDEPASLLQKAMDKRGIDERRFIAMRPGKRWAPDMVS